MRNERKLQYQKQRIVQLEERIKELEQDNESLIEEIERLNSINDIRNQELADTRIECEETKKEFLKGIAETKEMHRKYKEQFVSLRETKKQYEEEIKMLIKQLRKDIK